MQCNKVVNNVQMWAQTKIKKHKQQQDVQEGVHNSSNTVFLRKDSTKRKAASCGATTRSNQKAAKKVAADKKNSKYLEESAASSEDSLERTELHYCLAGSSQLYCMFSWCYSLCSCSPLHSLCPV